LQRFVLKETGWTPEKTYLEFNMPKVGKKSKFIERNFNFSSLVNLSCGKPEKGDVAKFMSDHAGMSYETAHMKLNTPAINHHAGRDIVQGRGIDMAFFF
jgi:hypothetical protein